MLSLSLSLREKEKERERVRNKGRDGDLTEKIKKDGAPGRVEISFLKGRLSRKRRCVVVMSLSGS